MAKILFEDPKVPLAAESGLWPWRLQEQAHGASAQAPSQWGAQSGHQQRPRQLDNVELDSSSKAEAACQVRTSSKPTSIPMLGMSLPRLPFSWEQLFCRGISKIFVTNKKWDRKKQLAKINFVLSDVYVHHWEHAFNGCFEKRVQTDNLADCLKCNWARNPSNFCSKIC
jgi:hypothetical protein